MDEDYTKEDLQQDLYKMVKAGLLDIYMNEDGQWLYSISEKAALMSDLEREQALYEAFSDEEDSDNP